MHQHTNPELKLVKTYLDREVAVLNMRIPSVKRILDKAATDMIEHLAEIDVAASANRGVHITLQQAIDNLKSNNHEKFHKKNVSEY